MREERFEDPSPAERRVDVEEDRHVHVLVWAQPLLLEAEALDLSAAREVF